MSARTFSLSNTLLDATGSPVVGRSITVSLIVPGSAPAIDIDSKAVVPDTVSATTDSTGHYSLTLLYPGDISPAGCVYSIDEAGTTVLSPVSWSYVSTISTWQWYAGGGPAGTLPCRLNVVLGNDAPVSGRYAHVYPQQNTVAPDSTVLSVFSSVDVLLDGTGRALFYLWPSTSLSPNTLYYLKIDGETTRFSFSVPVNPTGYQGAYSNATTYHVHDGTNYQGPLTPSLTPPDVVLYNGVWYQCIADTTGNLPTNTTYWTPWIAEPILWHVQAFGVTQAVPAPSTSIGHTSSVVPVAGAPVSSPATLADDLSNMAYEFSHLPPEGSVTFIEETTPASPASGDQTLFIDSADHKVKRVDHTGSVTIVEGGSYTLPDATTTTTGGVEVDAVPGSGHPIAATKPTTDAIAANVATNTTAIAGKVTKTGDTMTGELVVPDLKVAGLSGAATVSRYVGATTSGAPVAGSFATGDWVVDGTGRRWTCTAGGSPGTWTQEPGLPLPIATGSVLGGVKQGSGTTIASDGTISVIPGGVGNIGIEVDASNIGTRPAINFETGAGITFTAADDSTDSRVNVQIAALRPSSLLVLTPNPYQFLSAVTTDQPPDFIQLASGDVISVEGM